MTTHLKPLLVVLALMTGFAALAIAGAAAPRAAMAGETAATAPAGEATDTFTGENMTCALCPVTVRKTMERVEGVKSVTVDYEAKTATVRYDPAMATADAIAAASANAGYPAVLAAPDR